MNTDSTTRSTLDLLNISTIVSQRKWTVTSVIVLLTALSIIYALISTPLFRSTVSFYPQYQNDPTQSLGGGLQSLAAVGGMLGLNLNSGSQAQYYIPDILFSRTLRHQLVTRKWANLPESTPDLIRFWKLDQPGLFGGSSSLTPAEQKLSQEEDAMLLLLKRLSVREEDSGLTRVGVLMESRELAAEINSYVADHLKRVIATHYSEQSSEFSAFLEDRMAQAMLDLTLSEEILTEFRQLHLLSQDSAEDQLERGRLLRQVEINQQIYLTLRQQFELARLEELKAKPIIMVLDENESQFYPEKPRRVIIVMMGFLAGILGGILLALLLHLRQQVRLEKARYRNEAVETKSTGQE